MVIFEHGQEDSMPESPTTVNVATEASERLNEQPRQTSGPVLCPGCGYDMRGITGTKCPECGEVGTSAHPAFDLASSSVARRRRIMQGSQLLLAATVLFIANITEAVAGIALEWTEEADATSLVVWAVSVAAYLVFWSGCWCLSWPDPRDRRPWWRRVGPWIRAAVAVDAVTTIATVDGQFVGSELVYFLVAAPAWIATLGLLLVQVRSLFRSVPLASQAAFCTKNLWRVPLLGLVGAVLGLGGATAVGEFGWSAVMVMSLGLGVWAAALYFHMAALNRLRKWLGDSLRRAPLPPQ
jgi:hypothetical protein